MKKTQAITLLTIFLTALLITGCGFRTGRDEPPVSAEFTATGTDGIVMQFLPDQPPQKVYTGAPLAFLIEARNRGTHTLTTAMFYLTGYDPNMIIGMRPQYVLAEPLEGKSQFNPEGGYTTLEFESAEVNLPPSMPNYKPTFLLTACYPYQTTATPLVCVDPNPQDTISDKACTVQSAYSTGSQGAPVAVQSIESEANPRGMYFRIHVANVGGGEGGSGLPFSIDALGACPGQLTYRDLNTIRYWVELGGEQLFECQPSTGEVRLVDGRAVIFCKYNFGSGGLAYQTPLKVVLEYGYKNSISKVVEIENLNFAR
ncbi:hypothetical protein KY362_05490 [Candidatus Woesearchaeota archaeon]|nr:hypothetical protein [Candidatus Woesearchaeota archaeon]